MARDDDTSEEEGNAPGRRARTGADAELAIDRWRDFVFAPTLGAAVLVDELAVYALRTHRSDPPRYLRADEAGGMLRARFPGLVLANACDLPVLVVAGEPVRDRGLALVASQSLVVPARGEATLSSLTAAIHGGAGYAPEGGTDTGGGERTGPSTRPSPLESDADLVAELALAEPGQNGAVFAWAGGALALELFDAAETFAACYPRLLAAYRARARVEHSPGAPASLARRSAIEAFLGRVLATAFAAERAAGEGVVLTPRDPDLAGTVLTALGGVLHASLTTRAGRAAT